MKAIKYGYFGEDDAIRLFLHHYLKAVALGTPWYFELDEPFSHRYQATNKKQVDSLFAEACQVGLSDYQQDCFFVGRDLDDFSSSALRQKRAAMHEAVSRWATKAILLVPV
ncbi:hypothetical protein GCM10022408_37370 [Hymenobacter fastidiosus]|uniref:Uncharacterized protein n=1 Tax=Hymenobacter fastidiosus TaxID=486264 RepID=A0ABP7T1Y6_9BACT